MKENSSNTKFCAELKFRRVHTEHVLTQYIKCVPLQNKSDVYTKETYAFSYM